jgi:DNA end-binding protein Ku
MAARPSWEGHLRLSLVTCPVALWPASTEAQTVRFNMINPKTNNRIRMQTVDAGTGEQVARSDLVKGFEIARVRAVRQGGARRGEARIDAHHRHREIRAGATIDRLYWDTPYHLVPSGKTGIEAYVVIRAAMAKQSMVAIGRLVMSTRERICAIEIEEGALVLTTLRTAEQVRGIDQVALPDLPKPDPKMLQIAEQIVAQQSGDFDPSEFADRYEDALRALIEDKRKGNPVKSAKPANDDAKVIDLMAALRKSLESGGDGRRQRAERVLGDKARPRKAGGRTRVA